MKCLVRTEEIRAGIVIRGLQWKEPVEIKKSDIEGEYLHIIGSTVRTNTHIDQLISLKEIDSLSIEKIESDFVSEPNKVFLAFECKRYRYASLYDPLLAINISKVDPLPHQIEAVYGYILKMPRIRFLIADDTGAGKTIMAGLVVKELKLRNLIKRVLIVVPGHLKDQWRRELKERFEESFVVVDRGYLDSHYGENIWDRENQLITSIDFAKREDILPSIGATHFDLVIVDEAHKMSAYKYGNKIEKKERYKLGEVISRNTDNLLFLTATPHKGDPENFRLFLDLLEPGFFATSDMLQKSIENKDNPLFIRRLKEDMKDFDGKPLIPPRAPPRTLKFTLSENEKNLYNDVSRYVKEQYNRALAKEKRRNIAFALVILQRRLASSTYALLRSLERRKDRLEEIEKRADFRIKEDVKELVASQGKFEARIGNETVFTGEIEDERDIVFVCRNDGRCSGIRSCQEASGGQSCSFEFSIKLSQKAAERHAALTEDLEVNLSFGGKGVLSRTLDFYLDGRMYDSLQIGADLKGKAATDIAISGPGLGLTQEEAFNDANKNMNKLQTLLETGSLPTALEIVEIESVSPVLGAAFVGNALKIGLFGLLAVAVFIFIRYRQWKIAVPMVLTSAAEVFIIIGIAAVAKQNLDLAAIAGIIAAVGTGFDDLIIISDETTRTGEYAASSWKEKVKRAFFVIMVAWVVAVASMIPLFWAGAGLFTGFAITTIVGVTIGVFVTRPAYAAIVEELMRED